ncbi:MAG: efflux RND transporter periplasmic adaptor subunit [Verrucomicrobia bacterium]|nr:efflux RND transporter periplasmic adaptor subunit [Verrucomicrobiota bacterium]
MSVCKFLRVEALLLGVLGLFVVGCKPAEAPQMPVLPVNTQVVALGPFPQTAEVTAQVEGTREVEVRARVTGILLAQSYQEGAAVKAGDLLFKIDPAPYEVASSLAKAQLSQEQAKFEQFEAESARQDKLLGQRATSPKEAADAKAVAMAARFARDVAAAKVRGAELDLSYCEVRAPIAGYTGRLARSEGSLVSPGADGLLTTVVQREQVWARCGVSEQDFARLFQGDAAQATRAKVEVLDAAGKPLPIAGKINFVSAQVEARLGTIQMRAEFANPANKLLPGQFVRLRLEGKPLEGVVTLPAACLMQSAQGRFVYVLGEGNVATMRPVQIEVIIGPLAVVSGGLKSGDQVVLDNLVKIRPGSKLAPRAPAAK